MSNVANEVAAPNSVQVFLQKLYQPIYVWASTVFATKTEVAAATGISQASQQTCAGLIEEII